MQATDENCTCKICQYIDLCREVGVEEAQRQIKENMKSAKALAKELMKSEKRL